MQPGVLELLLRNMLGIWTDQARWAGRQTAGIFRVAMSC